MYKPMTSFNSFVKTTLLAKYANTEWIVDLAAGHGQDMFRISDIRIRNALFVDNDVQALSELVSRKHDFQKGITKLNTRIYTKHANLFTPYQTLLDGIKSIGVPIGNVDAVICNFAIHYFMGTSESIRNIIHLVHGLLKKGGQFAFTAFDGKVLFDLISDIKQGESMDIREGGVLKYSLRKMYSSNSFETSGQKVDVLLPFSGGKYYTEHLVNFSYLESEFTSNGFKVTDTNSFSTLLPRFKERNRNVYDKMNDHDKQFVSLYRYMVVTAQ
jgi:hypothetical protein